MKRNLILSIVLFTCSSLLYSQKLALFENKEVGIRFVSDSSWFNIDPLNSSQLEMINPNHNLYVKLWYDSSSKNLDNYIKEIVDREGLIMKGQSFKTIVDGLDAVGVIGVCTEMRKPVRVVMIFTKYEKGYYVSKFKCPEECFNEHKSQMQELIGSIHFFNKSESHIYFAAQNSNS